MRMQTLDVILDADPEFFSRHSTGRLVGIIVGQTGAAGAAVLAVIRQLSTALLMFMYVSIMLVLSAPLTLVTLFFGILVSVAVKANITRIRDFGVEAARVNQEMMGKVVERLGLVRLIKLRHQKQSEYERIENYSETTRQI